MSSIFCSLCWERAHMALRTENRPRRLWKRMKRSSRTWLQAMSFSCRSGMPKANWRKNRMRLKSATINVPVSSMFWATQPITDMMMLILWILWTYICVLSATIVFYKTFRLGYLGAHDFPTKSPPLYLKATYSISLPSTS